MSVVNLSAQYCDAVGFDDLYPDAGPRRLGFHPRLEQAKKCFVVSSAARNLALLDRGLFSPGLVLAASQAGSRAASLPGISAQPAVVARLCRLPLVPIF